MMRRYAAVLAACVLSSIAMPAMAQDSPPENDLVVVGERLQEMVRGFVGEIATAPGGEQQMARWDGRICPLVAGLPTRQMQYVADRIAQRAHQVDIETDGPGCSANILIFVTPDASRLAEGIVDEYRNLVAYYSTSGVNTLGRGPLEDFSTSSAPVRWWHVNQTVGADGQELGADTSTGGSQVIRGGPPPSRLRRATRQDFLRVLIIVDARQAQGVQLQALADYLAMVSLAQLDPDGHTVGVPTILNLFADRDSGGVVPAGMTEWDEAYLEGLYTARRTAPRDIWQRRDISQTMVERLDPSAVPAPSN
ncbi:MAG: hypothetical protein NT015_02940 [Alphaproteobacteria bacterium]|nr:hypothetical protein [Alphaproteobacteria bacterium]